MIAAPAKINIGLRILRKRSDGYHDIETIFHRIALSDEITLERSTGISFSSDDPTLPTDERNLCVRAAHLLRDEARGECGGVSIHLKKRIPAGAGLGGGSSDAASTLLGLEKLWKLRLTAQRRHALAATVGSDVPYFLRPGSASATGRGEVLEYFRLDLPYWILLVYPAVQVSTAWAYSQVRPGEGTNAVPLREILSGYAGNLGELSLNVKNDFEPAVFRSFPAVREIKERVISLGAGFAQMSGSGSSVYGFFEEERRLRRAAEILGERFSVFVTPPFYAHSSVGA